MQSPIFCNRQSDMKILEDAWFAATKKGGLPQIVVLLADSGMGKTRLAQEFFGRLSTTLYPSTYWPKVLEREGDNLLVNPPLKACNSTVIPPFLWWGLRFPEKTKSNACAASAIDADLPILALHLSSLTRSIRNTQRQARSRQLIVNFAADFGIELANLVADLLPGVATTKAAIKTAAGLKKLMREHFSDPLDLPLVELAQLENRSKTEHLAELFSTVMTEREHALPICILADDGHFSESDPEATDLLERLVDDAREKKWPFLLIVTYRPRQWYAKESKLAVWLQSQILNFKPHPLHKIPDLSPLLRSNHPGLTSEQSDALLARVDGNPQFLEEIIRYLHNERGHFKGRDPNSALTPAGFLAVVKVARTPHLLVQERIIAAGRPIREALALSSMQGLRFMSELTVAIAPVLNLGADKKAIAEAERPHAFIRCHGVIGEFMQQLYLEVAAGDLSNVTDATEARAALVATITRHIDDKDFMKGLIAKDRRAMLELAATLLQAEEHAGDVSRGILAEVQLVDELMEQGEYGAAGTIAAHLVDRWLVSAP